jgi:dissimilatory sulfite reductase (desulfoviridin) alpha/beta subunit
VVVQKAPGSSRRDFLKHSARFGLAVAGGSLLLPDLHWFPEILAAQGRATVAPGSLRDLIRTAPTARFWVSTATAAKPADCRACHDQGEFAAEHAHEEVVLRFLPGSAAYSIATAGCPLSCRFCDAGIKGVWNN